MWLLNLYPDSLAFPVLGSANFTKLHRFQLARVRCSLKQVSEVFSSRSLPPCLWGQCEPERQQVG